MLSRKYGAPSIERACYVKYRIFTHVVRVVLQAAIREAQVNSYNDITYG